MTDLVPGGGPFRAREVLRVLFSLALAAGMWVFVADEEGTEILVSAPLELRNVPPGLEVVSQSEQAVDIRLRGSSGLLRDAPLEDLRAGLDLTGELPGERTWFLGTEAVEAPSGVEVMRVDPSQVVLWLDRTVTNEVRVSPRVLGQPATGFEIHQVVIEPQELTVEGPETLLRDMEAITTEPISAQGLRETYAQRLQIELDPALRPSLRRVDVRLLIGEERETRELRLPVRPAVSEETGNNCDVLAPEVGATVLVPRSLTDALDAAETEIGYAEVDCSGLEAGSHQVVPAVVFVAISGPGLAVAALDPETVTVVVAPGEEAPPESGAAPGDR